MSAQGRVLMDGLEIPASKKTVLEVMEFVAGPVQKKSSGATLWFDLVLGKKAFAQKPASGNQASPRVSDDLVSGIRDFEHKTHKGPFQA